MKLVAVGVLSVKSLLNAVFVVELALIIGFYSASVIKGINEALKRVPKKL